MIWEAQILESLDHPNIVKFKRVMIHHYITIEMELLKGGHLKKVLKKWGTLKEDEVWQIASGLFEAIAYFHQRDYIHRDIKLLNVLLKTPNDFSSVKIVDFGLTEIYKMSSQHFIQDKIGTLIFMAPE